MILAHSRHRQRPKLSDAMVYYAIANMAQMIKRCFMPDNDNQYLFFESDALTIDTLLVSNMAGTEHISQLLPLN